LKDARSRLAFSSPWAIRNARCGASLVVRAGTSRLRPARRELRIWPEPETYRMHEVLEPTKDPGWVLSHEGYNVLTESAVESRLAFGNGFLGMRAARSVSRGPT
jgi:hypothetical protein